MKAQEEQKKEVSAQGEQESQTREGKAQEERRKEREVEAQEGHDGEEEIATQEKCVEAKKEANSMHEENDVSNRHMTWWKNAWWVRVDADGARPSTSVASSHEGSAGSPRDRTGRRGEREIGARDNGEKRKQHTVHNHNRSSSNCSSDRSNAPSVTL